jgi:hypothetical protein
MRAHHPIAIVAPILVGLGVKLIFFPAPIVEGDVRSVESMDVSEMQRNVRDLPVEQYHDMTFVFPE